MKITKKLSLFFTALFLCAGILFGTGMETQAAGVPKKARVYAGYPNNYGIEFDLANPRYTIKNLKSNSKYLIVKLTRQDANKSSYSGESNEFNIGTYAKKEGTYKISFDVYNGSKKVSSKTITVYAKNDSPVKTCKFSCKTAANGLTTAKTSTVKVTMNKGYKLKKIEVGTTKNTKTESGSIHSEVVYKTIKNGGKFTLGTQPYIYKSQSGNVDSDYYYNSYSENITAETVIRITYVDKYTKAEDTRTYSLSKLVK
ncbi:MAG: hypothetical protein SOZ59_07340 [Candidatus Limivivens sp.]|nr:hypothetical protein [Candidatus Limivivens sp.]